MLGLSLSNLNGKFLVLLVLGISGFSAQKFKAPPEIRQDSGPRQVIPVGQEQVKLQCNVKNAQGYSWYKNGVQITKSFSGRYSVKDFRYLEITNVVKSDSGVFVCVTSNKFGTRNYTVQLLIEDPTVSPTKITGEKPQFLYPEKMKPVKAKYNEGEKFQLTCEARGEPSPVVTWYKDGKVYTGKQGSGIHITPGEYDYKIEFNGVDISDKGTYTCNVSNAYGWLTYNYTVSVIEKIRSEPQIYFIWEQKNPLYVGESVEISCRVLTRDPKTKYRWYYSNLGIWRKDNLGALIDPSRYEQPPYDVGDDLDMAKTTFVLKFKNLTTDHSGLYGCQAENVAGNGSRQTNLTVIHKHVNPVTTDLPEQNVTGSGSEERQNEPAGNDLEDPQNEQSWISRIHYPGAVIGMLVAALIILISLPAWYCWKKKKSRTSRRSHLDSIHPRYEVTNEYVVVPDFSRG